MDINKIVNPLPEAGRSISNSFKELHTIIDTWGRSSAVYTNPDFQRGYVWTPKQKVAFIENYIKGSASLELKFATGSWLYHSDSELGDGMYLVDGLQRYTTLLEFSLDKFNVFVTKDTPNGLSNSQLKKYKYNVDRRSGVIHIYTLPTFNSLYQFYIDLNSGGTVHSSSELERVKRMIKG